MRWAGRWLRRALVLGLVLVVVVGWLAGWVTPIRPWEVSTGWEQIPQAQRAPLGTRLWPGKEAPRLHWLGHAGFLLDWAGTRLLLDPNESPWCTIAKRTLEPGRPPEELGGIDAVLVSHAHFDHLDLPTLRRLPRLGAVVLPMGSGRYVRDLEAKGTRVLDLAEGGSLQFGELEVVAVPARHNGNRWHPLTSHHGANGYVVRHGTEALYFAGDTGFGDHFTAIREAFHPRAAILPIGAYAPRFPMKYYHLSPEEAVAAARELGVERTIPAHFGTFALALDRPSSALPRFAAAAYRERLAWTMPVLLQEEGDGALASARAAGSR